MSADTAYTYSSRPKQNISYLQMSQNTVGVQQYVYKPLKTTH